MKKLQSALAIVLLITTASFAQLPNLDYTGYHIAKDDHFNYPDPNNTYPSTDFLKDPTFKRLWQPHADDYCTGWGYEIFDSSQVTMPSYGVIRLTADATTSPVCDANPAWRQWGEIPVSYVSGMLQSDFLVSFGIIEASLKLPQANAWPAFWTYPLGGVEGDNEIDIVDNWQGDVHKLTNHLFFTYQTPSQMTQFSGGTSTFIADLSHDFHKYSCVWTPSRVIFYYDEMYQRHYDFENAQTKAAYQKVLITLQTLNTTAYGSTMDIDWFKFWVQDCDEDDFKLETSTINTSAVTDIMTYPNLPTDHSKKAQYSILKNKNVLINVPYSYNGNVVRHVPGGVTFIEAESVLILPDFVADETVKLTKSIQLNDSIPTIVNIDYAGYMEIRSIQCGTDSTGWFKTASPTNIPIPKEKINNNKNSHTVVIYPNPNNGDFTIKLPDEGNYSVQIVNVVGQVLYQTVLNNKTAYDIRLGEHLLPGNYAIHIKDDNRNYVRKLVVIK